MLMVTLQNLIHILKSKKHPVQHIKQYHRKVLLQVVLMAQYYKRYYKKVLLSSQLNGHIIRISYCYNILLYCHLVS